MAEQWCLKKGRVPNEAEERGEPFVEVE